MLIGLVGKPSVGKSTFFKAATMAEVDIASYPFTTIKANHGVGYVKVDCIEKEFETKCNPNHGFCINSKRFVPVDIMDVAGLVEGASEGKGLGNQFLDDLRQADVFIHIVDASGTTDIEGKPTQGHNPCKDVLMLDKELDLWYYNILMKVWKSFSRKAELESKQAGGPSFADAVAKQFSGLKVNENQVKEVLLKLDLPERPSSWSEVQVMEFASTLRKKSKPMIIAANKCDFLAAEENIKKLENEFPDYLVYPCSADSELALRQAAKAEMIDYIPGEDHFEIKGDWAPKDVSRDISSEMSTKGKKQLDALKKIKSNVLEKYVGTGVQEVLNLAVFDLLGYKAIFPASANKLGDSKGNILPDCFLLPGKSSALDFAYFLHTDFGKNFIKAIDAKTKRALGKDYELQHRDAIEIITR